MTPRLYRLLVASGAVFGVTLVLVVLDAAAGVRLPQPVRPVLPAVLVLSLLVCITLLVGALGMPKRPGSDADDAAMRPGTDDGPQTTDGGSIEVEP